MSSKLTVNLGLRWEYASPITEKDNQQVNFDINTGEPIRPGDRGLGDGLYEAYYGGFSPRVGFAWMLNDKTVFRGGYGMVQYQEGTGANCRLPLNPPFFGEFTHPTSTPRHAQRRLRRRPGQLREPAAPRLAAGHASRSSPSSGTSSWSARSRTRRR